MEDFPWTHDQYQRYSVLDEFLKVFFGKKRAVVLDVGGLSPDRVGRTQWLPLQRILKEKSYVTDLLYCPLRKFVQGDGLFLPFKTGSFDVVSALDVIEHIPAEQRPAFIEELARVSRSGVVLSAPFKEERLEQVEWIIFKQIKELYGAEHQQLLEHKKHGLPEVEAISLGFSRHFPSVVDFGYGSLQNWLFYQSLKNIYLFKNKTGDIHSLIDRWIASCGQEAEFIPPFSRHFWIGVKDLSQEELESGTSVIKDNLIKQPAEKPDIDELGTWIEDITLLQPARNVSALVFSFGDGAATEECLNHLLTQASDFELDVSVMDLSPGQSTGKLVRERFPMVQIFFPGDDKELSSLLSRLTTRLKGDYFLWISDEILLPRDTAGKLCHCLKEASSLSVLIPWVDREGKDLFFWGKGTPSSGDRRRLQRVIEGKLQKKSFDFQAETAGWVYSECFFFSREVLLERDFSNQNLSRENIFLWSSIKPGGSFLRCPEILVHKKGTRKGSK
jgi:hypothetical protein